MTTIWPTVPLGDLLADIQSGFASGKHNTEGRGMPHLRPMNVSSQGLIDLSIVKYVDEQAAEAAARRLQPGDVLFNNTNSAELVGKTALFTGEVPEAAFSNHMTRVRTDVLRLDPAYLALRLHFAWREGYFAQQCKHHVSQASIGKEVLTKFPIELPPMEVQRAIATLANGVSGRRNSTEGHLRSAETGLRRFRESVLAYACSGQLTHDWREANPGQIPSDRETHARTYGQVDLDDLPELPDTWSYVSLGDLFDVVTGTTPSRATPEYYSPAAGLPFVKPTDLEQGIEVQYAREFLSKRGVSKARVLPPGTVCVTSIGATLGKTGRLTVPAATNQQINSLPPIDDLDSRFVYYSCTSPVFQRSLWNNSSSTTMPIINKTRFEALHIPVPPLKEQVEIVTRVARMLEGADSVERRVIAMDAALDEASRAFLVKAFRGELRVA